MRRKVKAFLQVLFNSVVPQTIFYSKVLKSRFIPSLSYFILLLLIVILLSVIAIFIQISKNNVNSLSVCLNSSLKEIPNNFSLNIKNGVLSTNHAMPLFVWFNCNDQFRLLAVIDERADKKDVQSYGAQILFTGREIVVRFKNHIFSWDYQTHIGNLNMDKISINTQVISALNEIKSYIPLFILSLLFCIPVFIFTLNIVNLLFSSIFVYIFYTLFKKHYRFKKVLQVGMHSSSLPLIISVLFLLFPIRILNTCILYFSLYFIFQLVAVYEAHYLKLPHKRS